MFRKSFFIAQSFEDTSVWFERRLNEVPLLPPKFYQLTYIISWKLDQCVAVGPTRWLPANLFEQRTSGFDSMLMFSYPFGDLSCNCREYSFIVSFLHLSNNEYCLKPSCVRSSNYPEYKYLWFSPVAAECVTSYPRRRNRKSWAEPDSSVIGWQKQNEKKRLRFRQLSSNFFTPNRTIHQIRWKFQEKYNLMKIRGYSITGIL